MLPEPVARLLADALPGAPIRDLAPTFGGFSNLTLACTLGGRASVLKCATLPAKRADVRREARVLARMRGAGLPAPPLVALAEDEDWTVAVTGRLPGEPGLRLYERSPDELIPAFAALGAALARVHDITPGMLATEGTERAEGGEPRQGEQPSEPRVHHSASFPATPSESAVPAVADLKLAARVGLAALPIEAGLRAALAAALDHPAWHTHDHRLVHGDAGLHNILWDGGVSGLLDWEWAGWGAPLVDLAWVRWTMRFRRVPVAAWRAFLGGYGGAGALDAGALGALALGQVAAILVRSYGRPGAWDEWLRRARWSAEA